MHNVKRARRDRSAQVRRRVADHGSPAGRNGTAHRTAEPVRVSGRRAIAPANPYLAIAAQVASMIAPTEDEGERKRLLEATVLIAANRGLALAFLALHDALQKRGAESELAGLLRGLSFIDHRAFIRTLRVALADAKGGPLTFGAPVFDGLGAILADERRRAIAGISGHEPTA